MGKAPADQFYWSDWLMDVELQATRPATRGIWMNALCRMWYSRTRGELTGTKESLPGLLNCTPQEFEQFLTDAQMSPFCHLFVTVDGKVTLRNRRMYRNEKAKENHRLRQERYREKHKDDGNSNDDVTPPSSSSSSSSINTLCPQQKIVDLWHTVLPELNRVKEWDETRQSLLRTRWRENPERQTLKWWEDFFGYIRKCPFLMGDIEPGPGRKRFQAKLPWVLKKANFLKIIEGDYEDG